MRIAALPGRLLVFSGKVCRRLKMYLLRPLFASHGRNFIFDPRGVFTFHHITVGDDVYIAHGADLTAHISRIEIGSKVLIAPNVIIRGGTHNTSLLGGFMYDVGDDEKRPEDDQPVTIEDDVWIGTRATILGDCGYGAAP